MSTKARRVRAQSLVGADIEDVLEERERSLRIAREPGSIRGQEQTPGACLGFG
jgi:hypothetical protein